MRLGIPLPVLLVPLVAAVAAAGGQEPDSHEQTPPRVEGLGTCSQRVERPLPARAAGRDDVRIGPVKFAALRRASRNPLTPGYDGGDSSWKSGIVVKAGPPVVLAIGGGRDTGVALDYDMGDWRNSPRRVDAGNGQAAVRVKPCPPNTRRFTNGRRLGRRTGFSGGFLVSSPACVTVQVFRGERTWSRAVGLGTSCEP